MTVYMWWSQWLILKSLQVSKCETRIWRVEKTKKLPQMMTRREVTICFRKTEKIVHKVRVFNGENSPSQSYCNSYLHFKVGIGRCFERQILSDFWKKDFSISLVDKACTVAAVTSMGKVIKLIIEKLQDFHVKIQQETRRREEVGLDDEEEIRRRHFSPCICAHLVVAVLWKLLSDLHILFDL